MQRGEGNWGGGRAPLVRTVSARQSQTVVRRSGVVADVFVDGDRGITTSLLLHLEVNRSRQVDAWLV